jgi:solute carrier family 25 (mitochondrial phosphate transporter), member 3
MGTKQAQTLPNLCKGQSKLICRLFADMAGPETAMKYQTPIFLAASASAEVIADVALCPWEAVKV